MVCVSLLWTGSLELLSLLTAGLAWSSESWMVGVPWGTGRMSLAEGVLSTLSVSVSASSRSSESESVLPLLILFSKRAPRLGLETGGEMMGAQSTTDTCWLVIDKV